MICYIYFRISLKKQILATVTRQCIQFQFHTFRTQTWNRLPPRANFWKQSWTCQVRGRSGFRAGYPVILLNTSGTVDLVPYYQEDDFILRGYLDADWVVTWMRLGQPQDMSSPFLGEPYHGAIRSKTTQLYRLRRQSMLLVVLPLSRQCTSGVFFQDLNISPIVDDPIEMLCNNIVGIQFAKNPKSHWRTKHNKRQI